MITLPISSVVAVILSLIYVCLSLNVIAYRRKNRISFGDNGDKQLERKIRAHANFIEYTPLVLILMVLIESQYPQNLRLIAMGSCFIAARLIHLKGILYPSPKIPFRVVGMVLTFSVILGLSGVLLAQVVFQRV